MNVHLDRRGMVITAVLLWKLALLVFARLPIPANDAFFYDGAVINYLLHGQYVNPSLALALPIAGTEVFSAYPPLYQVVLLPWMAIFGTSAYSAMWLHFILFAIFAAGLIGVFLKAMLPTWCRNVGALFLFGITFHDRPDSLAHALGIWAIFFWASAAKEREDGGRAGRFNWVAAVLVVLCLCTSLQIGGTYFLVGCTWFVISRGWLERQPAWGPWLFMAVVPVVLVGIVMLGFPHLWQGFLEHATRTPSFTGFRMPSVVDLLKVGRTVPGVMLAVAVVALGLTRPRWRRAVRSERLGQFACLALPAVALIWACLFVLTPNTVQIVNYLQPLIVGLFLGLCQDACRGISHERHILIKGWRCWGWSWLFCAVALVVSSRAIGLSTWGLSCVGDVSYKEATRQVREQLAGLPDGSTAVLSSAFLYEAANQSRVRCLHSDWPGAPEEGGGQSDLTAVRELKPEVLVLTQFDFYRRYRPVAQALSDELGSESVDVVNSASVPAPDSIPLVQRIVQHMSWAPVIVQLRWNGVESEPR